MINFSCNYDVLGYDVPGYDILDCPSPGNTPTYVALIPKQTPVYDVNGHF